MVTILRDLLSSLVDQRSWPVAHLTAITNAGPLIVTMSLSSATVGVDLDTVSVTFVKVPVGGMPVRFCRYCFQMREPSDALTA